MFLDNRIISFTETKEEEEQGHFRQPKSPQQNLKYQTHTKTNTFSHTLISHFTHIKQDNHFYQNFESESR